MRPRELKDNIFREGDTLIYKNGNKIIMAMPWGKDSLRVRIRPDFGEFYISDYNDWALNLPMKNPEPTITWDNMVASISNGKIRMTFENIYTQDGAMKFYRTLPDGSEKLVLENKDYVVHAEHPDTMNMTDIGNGLYHSTLVFEGRDGEHFYGMGENATSHLDLKGCVIDLYQRHIKAPIPFVMSTEMYGFLWNDPSLGRVEFASNMTRWTSYGTREMDFFVTVGDSFGDILSNYCDATGHNPEFPDWASGFWQCKLRYETQEQTLEVAREFHKRNIPLSVLVIDYCHWAHTGDWKLDPKFWPNPEEMMKELNSYGYRVMISPWPFVQKDSENYEYMVKNHLVARYEGHDDTAEFAWKPFFSYDPSNEDSAKFLWSKWKKNYVDLGIKTFWLDPCDDVHKPQDLPKMRYKIGSGLETQAMYVINHQKNIYNGLKEAGEKTVCNIARNAWAGSQRYGVCPAPHDIENSFKHLREYFIVGLNMMMSGIGWWNCDIGGFMTEDDESEHFHELMVRWYQWGLFMPVMRTHGCRKNNEPWTFGEKASEICQNIIRQREKLRPYIAKMMAKTQKVGKPIMRPLVYDYFGDEKVINCDDELLFGDDFLVAPILYEGMRERSVYLPKGKWVDVRNGKEYRGGKSYMMEAPLESIPILVKNGKKELMELFK